MKVMMSTFWITFFATTTLFSCLPFVTSQNHPTANLSTLWINNDNRSSSDMDLDPKSSVRIILRRGTTSGVEYACGFFCNNTCDSALFAVFIIHIDKESTPSPYIQNSEAVWSANRNNPVGINSTLELTGAGDLILRYADGTLAWSTNTAGKSAVGLNLTETGNLVLFDAKNSVVWQSFDHPTDCWLPGQILKSDISLTENGGLYSVSMTENGLAASILSDRPLVYYKTLYNKEKQNSQESYAVFRDGSIELYMTNEPSSPDDEIFFANDSSSTQYMKLGTDGHLRVFDWVGYAWDEIYDVYTSRLSDCGYPMICGKYGICSNGQCSCPSGTTFRPINDMRPDHGCSQVVPLTCNASQNHKFLEMVNVTYFAFMPEIVATDRKSCKDACLNNCSCKAVIFYNDSCYMPSEIFSLRGYDRAISAVYSVFLNVQLAPVETTQTVLWPALGSALGVVFVAIVIGTAFFVH